MKKPVHTTIRGIPAEVQQETKALAGRPQKADFSDLVGKWTPDPEFEKVVESQRRIDAGKWK